MLTVRGRFLVALVVAIVIAAISAGSASATILGAGILSWVLIRWMILSVTAIIVLPRLEVRRFIDGQQVDRPSIWSGRSARVRVEIQTSSIGFGIWKFSDRHPAWGEISGSVAAARSLAAPAPMVVEYNLVADGIGRIRFEGLQVELADGYGLFRWRTFLRRPVEADVLPPMSSSKGGDATRKRTNELPAQGIHRYRRAGSGTELLDLRDYIAGDPPKSIAWKVSARRDRLVTKLYESDVPVRCTFFVDASDSMRLGPPGKTLFAGAVGIVAALAERLSGVRDPSGLCLFDETTSTHVQAGIGKRHLVRMLTKLARAAGRPMRSADAPLESIVKPAFAFATEVYPRLLHPAINKPGPWYRRLLAIGVASTGWYLFIFVLSVSLAARAIAVFAGQEVPPGLLGLLWLSLIGAGIVGLIARCFRKRRTMNWSRLLLKRKQLASIVAVQDGLGPAGAELLLHDDRAFAERTVAWLERHRVSYKRPLYSPDGKYLYACPEKAAVLARALLRAVIHGRDNELFVIIADLLEIDTAMAPILKAIKVAVARRHQVVVVCPWPDGLTFPDRASRGRSEHAARANDSPSTSPQPPWTTLVPARHRTTLILEQVDRDRHVRAYHKLKTELARLRVPVLCTTQDQTVKLLVDRVEQLRRATIRR